MTKVFFDLKNISFLTILNITIGLLLLVSILFFLKGLVFYFYQSGKKDSQIQISSSKQPQILKNFNDYEIIIKNNPFGINEPGLKLLFSSQKSQTSVVDIKLVGTISGHNRYSYAIFSDKNNLQETIRVGQKVFDYGTLKKVEKDKAIIQNGAELLEIPLQDIVKIQELSNIKGDIQSAGFVKNLSAGTYMLDKKRILHAIDNPNELMTDARFQPNFIEGRQEGFILREVKNNGIYHNLGLQNGDVLLRINEYSIANPETALQAFNAMKGLDRIQLDIIRNGNKMTMTYLIK